VLNPFLCSFLVVASAIDDSSDYVPVEIKGVQPPAFREPSPDVEASKYFPLHRSRGAPSAPFLQAARQGHFGLSPLATHDQVSHLPVTKYTTSWFYRALLITHLLQLITSCSI
jgi:hypothetical protein